MTPHPPALESEQNPAAFQRTDTSPPTSRPRPWEARADPVPERSGSPASGVDASPRKRSRFAILSATNTWLCEELSLAHSTKLGAYLQSQPDHSLSFTSLAQHEFPSSTEGGKLDAPKPQDLQLEHRNEPAGDLLQPVALGELKPRMGPLLAFGSGIEVRVLCGRWLQELGIQHRLLALVFAVQCSVRPTGLLLTSALVDFETSTDADQSSKAETLPPKPKGLPSKLSSGALLKSRTASSRHCEAG